MNEEHEQRQYLFMSPPELEDTLAALRHEILKKVKRLERGFKRLMALQSRREKIEIRLEELGGTIGSVKSKAKDWEEGKEEEEEEK